MSKLAKRLIAAAVVVVLGAVALVITETTLRRVVPEQFAGHVREFIKLSDDHPVEVKLEGWVTGQLIVGAFDNVQIRVPDAPLIEGMRATLFGSAKKMPRNPSKGTIEGGTVGATFSAEQLGDIVKLLSRGVGQAVEIEGGLVTISNTISFFGQKFPIKLNLTAEAKDGALLITPVSLEAAGVLNLTVDQLSSVPVLEQYVGGFEICVADKLPRGTTLESIKLSTTQSLTVTLGVDRQIGLDPELQEFGTCEGTQPDEKETEDE